MTGGQEAAGQTRFFGLKINREVNVLALFAFILSISSLTWQGILMLRGSDLIVFPDDTVNIVLISNQGVAAPEEALQVVFNTYVSTVNEGAPGYDDTVNAMALNLSFEQDGETSDVTYPWFHFERFVPDPSGVPITQDSGSTHQFVVPGQGHIGHHITFAGRIQTGPTETINRAPLTWTRFRENMQANPFITLSYHVTARSGAVSRAGCVMRIGIQQIETLQSLRATTVVCQDVDITE